MRALITAALMASVLWMGCKDDPADSPDMKATADLTASGGGTKCGEILTCAQGCNAVASCVTACVDAGADASVVKFQTLLGCGYAVCLQAGDAGAAKCSSQTDQSAACAQCVSTAAQSSACTTQFQACFGD